MQLARALQAPGFEVNVGFHSPASSPRLALRLGVANQGVWDKVSKCFDGLADLVLYVLAGRPQLGGSQAGLVDWGGRCREANSYTMYEKYGILILICFR